jgi:hypothetical protein
VGHFFALFVFYAVEAGGNPTAKISKIAERKAADRDAGHTLQRIMVSCAKSGSWLYGSEQCHGQRLKPTEWLFG